MPVLWGKSSAEQVTLQSSQEENNDGKKKKTQAASEQRNSAENRGSQLGRRRDEAHFLFGRGEFQHM